MTPPDIGPLGEPLFERLGSEDPATLASLLVSGELPPHLLTYAAEIAGRELASDLVVAPLLCLVADASPVVREGAIRGLAYHVDDDRVLARISAAAASDPSPGVRSVASGVMEMRGQ